MDNPKTNAPIAGDSAKPEWYWPAVVGLLVLLAMVQTRDIGRPFYGLHSWGKAHSAWFGRVHAKHGFGYTKGLLTWAVGDPPPEEPRRYLDHPQLGSVLRGLEAVILGWSEWAFRTWTLAKSLCVLLLILAVVRGLMDEKTAILAGLILVLLPITGFFGYTDWSFPLHWVAIWSYLGAIGALSTCRAKPWHKWLMAGAGMVSLLVSWEGFFCCMAIGFHYIGRCVYRREWPNKALLTLMIASPALGIAINFAIMGLAWGDFGKIFQLFAWRSVGKPEVPFTWGDWFVRFWEHAETNFTWPVLILAGTYLLVGLVQAVIRKRRTDGVWSNPYLPGLGLFVLPAVFQIGILKNSLRAHQYWERPLGPFLALACAGILLLLWNVTPKKKAWMARVLCVLLLGTVTCSCAAGLNHYYYIRWQHPRMVRMLKQLSEAIPPDRALLSFEGFMIFEHAVKGEHYRPEIAYYLDRPIVQAQALNDILAKAGTGKYTYYLMPQSWPDERVAKYLAALTKELQKRFPVKWVSGGSGEYEKNGNMLRQGMLPYAIFDLRSAASPAFVSPGG